MARRSPWLYSMILLGACSATKGNGNNADAVDVIAPDTGVEGFDSAGDAALDTSADSGAELPGGDTDAGTVGSDADADVDGSDGDAGTEDTGPIESSVIVVNELMVHDPNGPDWVELLNGGQADVNLAGWAVGRETGVKGILPAVTVKPGEYYIVETALVFDLKPADSIRLTNKDGEVVGTAVWQPGDAGPGSTWGRFPNQTGPFKTLATPTKGLPNVDEGIAPCGNSTCDAPEECGNCPQDCGACPSCGDLECNGDETCSSCAGDCGACPACGNTVCAVDEDCFGCPQDCGACAEGCGATLYFGAYIEGSSKNKAVEIVNYTGAAVDLSTVAIWYITNGGLWDEAKGKTDVLTGVLAHGATLVLCNTGANAGILAVCDQKPGGSMGFNGDDALGLAVGGVLVDTIGEEADPPPANGWEVNGVKGATEDHTLIRKSAVITGNTSWASASASEWILYDKDELDAFGNHKTVGNCAPVTVGAIVALNEATTGAVQDFVEIVNRDSLNSVDLAGWTVSIGAWTSTFAAGSVVQAGAFVSVGDLAGGGLPSAGGLLTLTDAEGAIVDSTDVPADLTATQSYGRIPDGDGAWKILETTSIADPNIDNPLVCGDSNCQSPETCTSCAKDCGTCPKCGDGACAVTEDCTICPGDCGACADCGDAVCVQAETCASCALDCGACSVGCGPALFFSEYVEGTSFNKGVEIVNRTGIPVDLADYEVWKITNGGDWAEGSDSAHSVGLTGTLYPDEVFTFCETRATLFAEPCDLEMQSGPMLFNGDDAIALAKDGVIVDVIGTDGTAPDTGWDVGGQTKATAGHTLRRKETINSGNPNWATSAPAEWVVLPENTVDGYGQHTTSLECVPNIGCDDSFCDANDGETCELCPEDCGFCPDICGNTTCGAGETCTNCPEDCDVCPSVCSDTKCEGTETCTSCPDDCGACPDPCGNTTCAPSETCLTCEADCGVCPDFCGNATCGEDETCDECPEDCGECPDFCGNELCGPEETCTSCSIDCGPCPEPCGNLLCLGGETCATCPGDCGACPATCSSGLFFSEYVEGASNNKALELYNDTGADVSLSDYRIDLGSNGGAVAYANATPLSGTLAPGETYVICHTSSVAAVKVNCDKQFNGTIAGFNGDDAIVLYMGQIIVDAIGKVGESPTGGWTVAGVTKATTDHTLRRLSSSEEPQADWAVGVNGWQVLPVGTHDGLGQHQVDGPCVGGP